MKEVKMLGAVVYWFERIQAHMAEEVAFSIIARNLTSFMNIIGKAIVMSLCLDRIIRLPDNSKRARPNIRNHSFCHCYFWHRFGGHG